MSDIITTLHEKGNPENAVYPNIKGENIPENAITTAKVNDNAITNEKINDGAISTSKIQDGSITNNKIGIGAVSGINLNFGIFEHIYECTDSVQHISYIIRFMSAHQPFNDAVELFDYLYTYYGVGAPVAIQKNTNDLTDIFGYINDENNIEFTDTNDETFNSNYSNVTFADYSKSLY